MTFDPNLPPHSQPPQGYWVQSEPEYRRSSAPATIVIVATTIAAFLVQLVFQKFLDSPWFTFFMAFSPRSLPEGHYWQIISYAWIHSVEFPIHILVNMWMVWLLGAEVERILGSLRFLLIYLGGAIGAALAFWALTTSPWMSVAGASGSAFALLTALAVLRPKRRISVLLFFIIPLRMRMATMALLICGIEGALELINWIPYISHLTFDWLPSVSHSAHLGGALFGAVAAYFLKPPASEEVHTVVFTSGQIPPV